MSASILVSIKKILGIEENYSAFDIDVIMHINSVFARLNQLGIGPERGFMIEDAAPTWDDFLGGDLRLNSVKSYVYLRVKLLFDTPTTSFLIDSMNEQLRELEWCLNVTREHSAWVDPNPRPPIHHHDHDLDLVLDGGQP